MVSNNFIALLIVFGVSVAWPRLNDFTAHRGWISSQLSRKIIHMGTGPLYVLCWPFFTDSIYSRYLAARVPLVITIQSILVGVGVIKDQAAVQAMSRTGNPREILRGPLFYGIIFVVLTIIYWYDSPIGIVALMLMCGGDGLADSVASSSYIAIVPLLFTLLFATVLDGAPRADAHFALLGALSLVVAGIAAPLIGALADRGRLLTWLAAATAVCCAACAVMPSLRAGDVLLASLAFVAAQSGYTVAMVLYESFLPRLATASAMARVSAFGWAAGLCGGMLAVAIAFAVVRGRPDAEAAALAIGVAAVVFALLALPALRALQGMTPARLSGLRISTCCRRWRGSFRTASAS